MRKIIIQIKVFFWIAEKHILQTILRSFPTSCISHSQKMLICHLQILCKEKIKNFSEESLEQGM